MSGLALSRSSSDTSEAYEGLKYSLKLLGSTLVLNSKFEHEVKTNTDAASKAFVSKFEYIYIPRNMKRQVTLALFSIKR